MYSHTHAYIHYGFSRVARDAMGWDVEWLPDTNESKNKLNGVNLTDYLFLTVGGSCKFMPHDSQAYYVLHNVDVKDVPKNVDISHLLILQVYTKDVHTRNVIELNVQGEPQVGANVYHYWQQDGNVVYFSWATELTPNEINKNIAELPIKMNQRDYHRGVFVGSVSNRPGDEFGNYDELQAFKNGFQSTSNGNVFETKSNMNEDLTIDYIQKSGWAPTLVGTWQKQKGYIPCRIFKAMSYGHLGLTNSWEAFVCTGTHGIFNKDEFQLGEFATKTNPVTVVTTMLPKILDGMKYIRDNHTYLNRLNVIRKIFQMKQQPLLLSIVELPLQEIEDKQVTATLTKYQKLLTAGTYAGNELQYFNELPKSRYDTFMFAFQHFVASHGKVIVELGTTRSFTHGGHIGCNSNDIKYWHPNNPEDWDWGAGSFTQMAIQSLIHTKPILHTVDLMSDHIQRCKIMTSTFQSSLQYHVKSSAQFLQSFVGSD